jgi:SAM-dependent methyltransferase
MTPSASVSQQLYTAKARGYFQYTRVDMAAMVLGKGHQVLDVGCGAGRTGALLKAEGKAQRVIGVELIPSVADEARQVLDDVICGDIEQVTWPYATGTFDYILFGDVLEHTIDPWRVLARIGPLLAQDGFIVASVPNVRNWHVLAQLLLAGDWAYGADGILDQSHLRFFTRKSCTRMLREAGYEVVEVRPLFQRRRHRLASQLTLGAGSELLARQWLIKGCRAR